MELHNLYKDARSRSGGVQSRPASPIQHTTNLLTKIEPLPPLTQRQSIPDRFGEDLFEFPFCNTPRGKRLLWPRLLLRAQASATKSRIVRQGFIRCQLSRCRHRASIPAASSLQILSAARSTSKMALVLNTKIKSLLDSSRRIDENMSIPTQRISIGW